MQAMTNPTIRDDFMSVYCSRKNVLCYSSFMKLISLNTWGGQAGIQELLDFFKSHQDVDVFCLQEIFNGTTSFLNTDKERAKGKTYDLLTRIQEALPGYNSFFSPQLKEDYGIAIFVRKEISVLSSGEYFVHKFKGFIPEGSLALHARTINYIQVSNNGKLLNIVNVHGLWDGGAKSDTPDRRAQSEKIITQLSQMEGEIVFAGDLNLGIETESIKMIENSGLRNLIKEFGISSTRTHLYEKQERFADYVFVSTGVTIKDFQVLPNVVSDHAPLYLEFIS